ncbi:DNA replication licensing factor MCM4, partial [Tanacetum coccineum]
GDTPPDTSTPGGGGNGPSSEGDDAEAYEAPPMYVWGTSISVQDVNAAILRFLKHFREHPSHDEGKYMKAIDSVIEMEGESLEVDANDVFDYDNDLYTKMVRYPLEVLAIFDIVLMDMVSRINPLFEKHIQARIFNLKASTSMRNLNPAERRCLEGNESKYSARYSRRLGRQCLGCLVCGHFSDPIIVERGRINEPTMLVDKQIVRFQETPDEIPEGGTPLTMSLLMHDKLVNAAKPGDRVEITRIYKAMIIHVGQTQRTVKSLFKSRMNAEVPMETEESSIQYEQGTPMDYGDQVEKLKELSKKLDVNKMVTRGLTLQSRASFRGDISILLVGDLGTSKSPIEGGNWQMAAGLLNRSNFTLHLQEEISSVTNLGGFYELNSLQMETS